MSEIIKALPQGIAIDKVITVGDLSTMTAVERVRYYLQLCHSLGLNPLTKPFDYLELEEKENGQTRKKLILYANQNAAAQLRQLRKIDISIVNREIVDGVYIVTAKAKTPDGRTDEANGIIALEDFYGKPLKGRMKADAMMKAETKAKRRVTFSICGLGWVGDEDSGRSLSASVYDPPLDVILEAPAIAALSSSQMPTEEIWRTWKTPEDAIAWACFKLPNMSADEIRSEFEKLAPSNGKKAPAWVERVSELEPF